FDHRWPSVPRLVRYHWASAGALAIYWVVLNALSLAAGVPYQAAFVVGTAAAFTWSLITNFAWVWGSHNLPRGSTGYGRLLPLPHPFRLRKLSRGE
ncbi:MAG TPA: hypothetical protein VGK33_13730, partial [Chloroflexota bacterium]